MHKDQNNSNSLPGAGRPLNPDEHNGRLGDGHSSGGRDNSPKLAAGGGNSADRSAKPRHGVIPYPDRPSSSGRRRKGRNHRHRRPKGGPADTACRTNRTSQLTLPRNPGGGPKGESGAVAHKFSSVMVHQATPGKAAQNKTGTGRNTVQAAGSRQETGANSGYQASRRPMHCLRWKAKVKNAKDVLQKILRPFRLFTAKRVHLKVAPNTPGERIPQGSPTNLQGVTAVKSRPRIVVDTNVIMGGLINPSKASGRIISIWLAGRVDVVVSPALLDEYLHIFNKMRFGSKEALTRREEAMKKLLRHENLTLVEPELKLQVVKEDPSDNRLIECAVSGRADYIISQDRHLLSIGQYKGIKILRAQAFLMQEYPEGRN
ncbi:MAG: putative toxin-antitoxin system toxin component, PIN family [Bacillota bacterium]